MTAEMKGSSIPMVPGLILAMLCTAAAQTTAPADHETIVPAIVDLDIGAQQTVKLCNGRTVRVQLLEVQAQRDAIRHAVRRVDVVVTVDDEPVSLVSSTYHLPVTVGSVQIDCPITRDYLTDTKTNFWALSKAARLRLWPAGSPLLEPGTFGYPLRQRWFAGDTQMGNDPCYIGGEPLVPGKIYYHSGLDFGGCEDLVDLVAAVDGQVVSVGDQVLPAHKVEAVQPRYDRVHILDARGWYVRYSHVKNIAPSIHLGDRVHIGDKLGVLGKEGTSGGWSHLHFEIFTLMPTGRYGSQDAYAYAWEAWQRAAQPQLIAVARPHQLVPMGTRVRLDGARSWSANGQIISYAWKLSSGREATGPIVEAEYADPGYYSEILKITDAAGHTAYDFAVVQVFDPTKPKDRVPGANAAYAPTQGLRPGQTVTFKVRTFKPTAKELRCDFGDGTPAVTVPCDGNVKPLNPQGYTVLTHAFTEPGDYIFSASSPDSNDLPVTTRLWVHIEP